jgi:hypothetical protein
MDKAKLIELAERCEAATGPDVDALLQEAWAAIFPKPDRENEPPWQGPGTKREPLFHEWKVRQLAFQALLSTRGFLDAAMTLAEPFVVVALSDIAADGMTGCCIVSDTSTNPPVEHWGIPSERCGDRRSIWARAVCAAALRALASQQEPNVK